MRRSSRLFIARTFHRGGCSNRDHHLRAPFLFAELRGGEPYWRRAFLRGHVSNGRRAMQSAQEGGPVRPPFYLAVGARTSRAFVMAAASCFESAGPSTCSYW